MVTAAIMVVGIPAAAAVTAFEKDSGKCSIVPSSEGILLSDFQINNHINSELFRKAGF